MIEVKIILAIQAFLFQHNFLLLIDKNKLHALIPSIEKPIYLNDIGYDITTKLSGGQSPVC